VGKVSQNLSQRRKERRQKNQGKGGGWESKKQLMAESFGEKKKKNVLTGEGSCQRVQREGGVLRKRGSIRTRKHRKKKESHTKNEGEYLGKTYRGGRCTRKVGRAQVKVRGDPETVGGTGISKE